MDRTKSFLAGKFLAISLTTLLATSSMAANSKTTAAAAEKGKAADQFSKDNGRHDVRQG